MCGGWQEAEDTGLSDGERDDIDEMVTETKDRRHGLRQEVRNIQKLITDANEVVSEIDRKEEDKKMKEDARVDRVLQLSKERDATAAAQDKSD